MMHGQTNIKLKWILRNMMGSIDLIYVTQDGDIWRAVVNAVMNIWSSEALGIS